MKAAGRRQGGIAFVKGGELIQRDMLQPADPVFVMVWAAFWRGGEGDDALAFGSVCVLLWV